MRPRDMTVLSRVLRGEPGFSSSPRVRIGLFFCVPQRLGPREVVRLVPGGCAQETPREGDSRAACVRQSFVEAPVRLSPVPVASRPRAWLSTRAHETFSNVEGAPMDICAGMTQMCTSSLPEMREPRFSTSSPRLTTIPVGSSPLIRLPAATPGLARRCNYYRVERLEGDLAELELTVRPFC